MPILADHRAEILAYLLSQGMAPEHAYRQAFADKRGALKPATVQARIAVLSKRYPLAARVQEYASAQLAHTKLLTITRAREILARIAETTQSETTAIQAVVEDSKLGGYRPQGDPRAPTVLIQSTGDTLVLTPQQVAERAQRWRLQRAVGKERERIAAQRLVAHTEPAGLT